MSKTSKEYVVIKNQSEHIKSDVWEQLRFLAKLKKEQYEIINIAGPKKLQARPYGPKNFMHNFEPKKVWPVSSPAINLFFDMLCLYFFMVLLHSFCVIIEVICAHYIHQQVTGMFYKNLVRDMIIT